MRRIRKSGLGTVLVGCLMGLGGRPGLAEPPATPPVVGSPALVSPEEVAAWEKANKASPLDFTIPFIMGERFACPLVTVYLKDAKTQELVGGWFMVDTGSEGTYVSDAFAKRLGLPRTNIQLPRAGSKETIPYEMAPHIPFQFGRVAQPVDLLVISPNVKTTRVLFEMAQYLQLDGVLGTNFLNNFSVVMDNRAQTLSFFREKTWTPEELARTGFTGEGATLGANPHYKVLVRVEQEPVELAVDTGGYRTMLPGRFAQTYKNAVVGKEIEKSMAREVDIRLVRVPSLTVGGQVLRDRVFGALSRAKDDSDLTLILGQDVFSRMDKVLFDLPKHKLYLQKSDDSVDPYPTAAAQENAVRLMGQFNIKPNAHGEWQFSNVPHLPLVLRDTDLRTGDLLTAIDGVPLQWLSPDEVAQKLREVRGGQMLALRRRIDSSAPLLEVQVKVGGQKY